MLDCCWCCISNFGDEISLRRGECENLFEKGGLNFTPFNEGQNGDDWAMLAQSREERGSLLLPPVLPFVSTKLKPSVVFFFGDATGKPPSQAAYLVSSLSLNSSPSLSCTLSFSLSSLLFLSPYRNGHYGISFLYPSYRCTRHCNRLRRSRNGGPQLGKVPNAGVVARGEAVSP